MRKAAGAGSAIRGDEAGATATEYGLLVLFIAFAIFASISLFGTALGGFYTSLTAGVQLLVDALS